MGDQGHSIDGADDNDTVIVGLGQDTLQGEEMALIL